MTNDKKAGDRIPTRKLLTESQTYAFCHIHKTRYPKGGRCPRCMQSAKNAK